MVLCKPCKNDQDDSHPDWSPTLNLPKSTAKANKLFKKTRLHRPAFKDGRDQITGAETERSRIIANERIRIERVIGNLKMFMILRGIIKIKVFSTAANYNAFIHKIFAVCCLMNAQPTTVPQY